MEKEHREDYEVIVRKGLNPECPECGNARVYEEGCVKCHTCGYSECQRPSVRPLRLPESPAGGNCEASN